MSSHDDQAAARRTIAIGVAMRSLLVWFGLYFAGAAVRITLSRLAPPGTVLDRVVLVASLAGTLIDLTMLACTYRLARVLGRPALLWVVLMLLPLANWLVLLKLNDQAGRELRLAGLDVGFFGPSRDDLARYRAEHGIEQPPELDF